MLLQLADYLNPTSYVMCSRFNSMELLLFNGMLSLPVLFIIVLGIGEVGDLFDSMRRQSQESLAFLPLLMASLLMGSLLNYCLFHCTLCNPALTTTIVGSLRSVLGTVSLLSNRQHKLEFLVKSPPILNQLVNPLISFFTRNVIRFIAELVGLTLIKCGRAWGSLNQVKVVMTVY